MREGLRLNKENLILFLNEKGIKIAGMWVFVGSEIIDFPQMKTAVVKTIDKLKRLLYEQQS